MFTCEEGFSKQARKHGRREAIELDADINEWTKLRLPKTPRAGKDVAEPSLHLQRTLFDYNEHFIELSNMGEQDRSLELMVSSLGALLLAAAIAGAVMGTIGFPLNYLTVIVWLLPAGAFALVFALWRHQAPTIFFTALRARYRFNRTTGKVYALRPKRFGGNVILDWDRVQAHVNWCAPREMNRPGF